MSSLGLEDFPCEIVESIVLLLDLEDIRSLRLTSRALASKATQQCFKTYCYSKHVDATPSGLEAFVQATRPGQLGCLLWELVLVGVVNDTSPLRSIVSNQDDTHTRDEVVRAQKDPDTLSNRQADYEEFHNSGRSATLLGEAFINLNENGQSRKLQSLSLSTTVYREDAEQRLPTTAPTGWRLIWHTAADIMQITFSSLAASALPVEHINLYQNIERGSVACNELNNINFTSAGLATSLASLKSLSLSFSEKIIQPSTIHPLSRPNPDDPQEERDRPAVQQALNDPTNSTGIAKLLHLCPNLQHLDLHQYQLHKRGLANPYRRDTHFFAHISASAVTLTSLTNLTLRGLSVRENDLSTFLKRTPSLRNLALENVNLPRSDSFEPVFEYCTSEAAALESLYFHELTLGTLVYFDAEAEHSLGPNTLARTGEGVRGPIFHRATGKQGLMKRNGELRRVYGPP